MLTINLTRRQARLLRQNLTNNQQGYDFVDLRRLDRLANQLTDLQGEYAERMAELARDEKRIRRFFRKEQLSESEANRQLALIADEVEDLDDEANTVSVDFEVSEADHRLIRDKLDNAGPWLATDDLRPVILGMVDAVHAASEENKANGHEPVKEPTKLRR